MILVNGQPDDKVSPHDRGLQYGDGVFETIAVKAGEPLALEEHLTRLSAGAQALYFPPLDIPVIMSELTQAINTESGNSVLKIIVTRGDSGRGYRPPVQDVTPSRIISTHPWPDYNHTMYESGVKLTLCETRLSQNRLLAGIKHLNRLEQVLARNEWDDADIFEGVMLDTDGNVIECTMSNLFMIRGQTLFTPALESCGIHGIIRRLVMDAAAESGLDCRVKQLTLDDLDVADEMFISNSILGICHVREFREKHYQRPVHVESIRNLLAGNDKIISL